MPEDAAEIVAKRRAMRVSGRTVCIACGSVNTATGGAASPALPYRILRGGMHVGNQLLSRDDHLCRFCVQSGQVKERPPV